MNVLIAIFYSSAWGFQKWILFKGKCEKTGGDGVEEGVDGGLAECFHSCHGDELGCYD